MYRHLLGLWLLVLFLLAGCDTSEKEFTRVEGERLKPSAQDLSTATSARTFPSLGDGVKVQGGVSYFVDTSNEITRKLGPGEAMQFKVLLPEGDHAENPLPCVLIAPAGTTLAEGQKIKRESDELGMKEFLDAGMAVVCYSLDGDPGNSEDRGRRMQNMSDAYQAFKKAEAGLVNARLAVDFALQKLPVDPQRIYCAGHSSAATMALLLASHDERISGCLAFAPVPDVEAKFAAALQEPQIESIFPEFGKFVRTSSPKQYAADLSCPLFVFHARDDGIAPFSLTQKYVEEVKKQNSRVKFISVDTGGHAVSVYQHGLKQGVEWLKKLSSEQAGAGD